MYPANKAYLLVVPTIGRHVPVQTSNSSPCQSVTFLAECHPEISSGCCPEGLCLLLESAMPQVGTPTGVAFAGGYISHSL